MIRREESPGTVLLINSNMWSSAGSNLQVFMAGNKCTNVDFAPLFQQSECEVQQFVFRDGSATLNGSPTAGLQNVNSIQYSSYLSSDVYNGRHLYKKNIYTQVNMSGQKRKKCILYFLPSRGGHRQSLKINGQL